MPLMNRYIRRAAELGSQAATAKGALRYLLKHPRPVFHRPQSPMLESEWRKAVAERKSHPEAKRAAADKRFRRSYLSRLRRELAGLVNISGREEADARIAHIRTQYGIIGRPMPELPQMRWRQYEELIRPHGPIPGKQGAGRLVEHVSLRPGINAPICNSWSERGDQSSVANSYQWAVRDHHVHWIIPSDHELCLIGGLVTCRPIAADSRKGVVHAWFARKGRGYAGQWEPCRLYRGYHTTHRRLSDESLMRDVDRYRRERARDLRAQRRQTRDMREIARTLWITPSLLQRLGACTPGILYARLRAERLLGAEGELGGVRADWALGRPEFAGWAVKAIAHLQQERGSSRAAYTARSRHERPLRAAQGS